MRQTATRAPVIISVLSVLLAAGCDETPSCCATATEAAAALPGASIYQLASAWRGTSGEPVPLTALRGQPTVVALVFTHCQYACPRVVADLQDLARRLPAAAAARFALFSMDPARDTPQRLAEFAAERQLDPERFALFTADDAAVRELAAVLGLRYKRLENGDFTHSNGFVVLDADGVIAARVDGLGADPTPALKALMQKP